MNLKKNSLPGAIYSSFCDSEQGINGHVDKSCCIRLSASFRLTLMTWTTLLFLSSLLDSATGMTNSPTITQGTVGTHPSDAQYISSGGTLTVSNDYFTLSTVGNTFGFAITSSTPTVMVSNFDSSVTGSYNPSAHLTTFGYIAFQDPLYLYIMGLNNDVTIELTIQANSGVYSVMMSYLLSNPTPASDWVGHLAAASQVGTNYVYYGGGTKNIFGKVDVSSMSGTSVANTNLSGTVHAVELFNNAVIMANTGTPTYFFLVDNANLGHVGNITSGSLNMISSAIDNLNYNHYFQVGTSGGAGYLRCWNIQNLGAIVPAFTDLTNMVAHAGQIFNFGSYQFVGFRNSDSNIVIVYKNNFTKISFPALAFTVDAVDNAYTGTFMVGIYAYFMAIRTDGSNKHFVQSYYIWFDKCLTWNTVTPTICDLCIQDYYRNSTASGNACFTYSEFPQYTGADVPNNLIKPCSQASPSICLTCTYNYQQCSNCSTGYSVDNQNGSPTKSTCLTTAQVSSYSTPTWGIYPYGGINYAAACMTGCLNCTGNINTCITCDKANQYFLNSGDSKCYLYSALNAGTGGNTTSGLVANCADPQCDNCQANNSICTHCNTSNLYFLNTTVSPATCVLYTTIASGKGGDPVSSLINPCNVSNCLICQANYTVCTGCDYSSGYYLYNSTSCLNKTSFPAKYGVNTSAHTAIACQDSSCVQCIDNYTNCTRCDYSVPSYLPAGATSCQPVTPTTQGIGLDSVAQNYVPCQQTTECQLCVSNYTLCTQCDKANHWYLNTTDSLCYLDSKIVNFTGANTASGNITACQMTGCQVCNLDYTVCTACNTSGHYYFYPTNSTCYLDTAMPVTLGADNSTGNAVTCQEPNCTVCGLDYTNCTQCDYANYYYLMLPGHNCILRDNITNYLGPNLTSYVIENCTDANCVQCNYDKTKCKVCNTSIQYYLLPSNASCLNFSQIPDGLGANLTSGSIDACPANCLKCANDSSICQTCDSPNGYFLTSHQCVLYSNIPDYFGGNHLTGNVEPCLTGCKKCQQDITVCTFCDVSNLYYLNAPSCFKTYTAPSGFGLNTTSSLLNPCTSSACLNCSDNIDLCTQCNEDAGYYLEEQTCYSINSQLQIMIDGANNISPLFSITWVADPGVDSALYYGFLQSVLETNFTLFEAGNQTAWKGQIKSTTLNNSDGLMMNLSFNPTLTKPRYMIHLVGANYTYHTKIDGVILIIETFNSSFYFDNPAYLSSLGGLASQGSTVGTLTSMGGGNSAVLTTLMTITALDPTGVLMKFNQILKIINKLYFININYGTRLDAFLASIGNSMSLQEDEIYNLYHSKDYRGKITKKKIPLNFINFFTLKATLYGSSAIFQGFNFIVSKIMNVHVIGLWYMWGSAKVHLIIFNLVFIDFIWHASNTMLHSKDIRNADIACGMIMLCLVCFDIWRIVSYTFNSEVWNDHLKEKLKLIKMTERIRKMLGTSEWRERELKMQQEESRAKKILIHHLGDNTSPDALKADYWFKKHAIDYERTYFEIFNDVNTFNYMSNTLRTSKEVYTNQLCRSLYLIHSFRIIWFHMAIMGGSYCNALILSSLFTMEVSRISISVYCYVKYKYLKNIICLLMEVSQSFFLMLFLLICFCIHRKRFDEIILDFYQDAGIWIVIASCVAEYLLLLTYIGVAAYDFFKNRKARNEAKKQVNCGFIKYGADLAESEKLGYLKVGNQDHDWPIAPDLIADAALSSSLAVATPTPQPEQAASPSQPEAEIPDNTPVEGTPEVIQKPIPKHRPSIEKVPGLNLKAALSPEAKDPKLILRPEKKPNSNPSFLKGLHKMMAKSTTIKKAL